MKAWTRFLLIFPIATLAAGCAALQDPAQRTWLALHAIDSAQTYAIVDDPCYREKHPVTRELIGEHPSHAGVLAWSIASAALHTAVTDWLLRTERTRLARAWQWVTIGEKGLVISKNHANGVRLTGRNRCGG